MKNLPFVCKPTHKVVPVGNSEIGVLYLLSKGGITPNENPVNFQEQQRKQQKFLLKLNKRIQALAKEYDVPVGVMRKKVMESDASQKRAEDGALVDAEVDDNDGQGIFDYLDEDTADLLFGLQEDKRAIAIRAATFMLQRRVAYPVKLKANALAGSQSLVIETPQAPVGEGAHIKFGSSYIEVSKSLIPSPTEDNTSLLSVRETLTSLTDGDVGYLCEADSTGLKIGYPEWGVDDTRDYLGEELISALYEFYLKESGAVPENEVDTEAEGKSLTASSQSLTGARSSTGSSGLESATPGSVTKTLETSPVG